MKKYFYLRFAGDKSDEVFRTAWDKAKLLNQADKGKKDTVSRINVLDFPKAIEIAYLCDKISADNKNSAMLFARKIIRKLCEKDGFGKPGSKENDGR